MDELANDVRQDVLDEARPVFHPRYVEVRLERLAAGRRADARAQPAGATFFAIPGGSG